MIGATAMAYFTVQNLCSFSGAAKLSAGVFSDVILLSPCRNSGQLLSHRLNYRGRWVVSAEQVLQSI